MQFASCLKIPVLYGQKLTNIGSINLQEQSNPVSVSPNISIYGEIPSESIRYAEYRLSLTRIIFNL